MQNDFEKDITQRLQDFNLAPQPEIWQRVEAALPPQKKRRRLLFWWWLPVVAGLLAGGIWLMMDRKPKPSFAGTIQVPAPQTTSSTPAPDTQTTLPEKSISQPASTHDHSVQKTDSSPSKRQQVKKEKPVAETSDVYEDGQVFTIKRTKRPPTQVVRNTTINNALSPAVSAGNAGIGQSVPREREQPPLSENSVNETIPVAPASATPQMAVTAPLAKKDSTQTPDSVAVALKKVDTTKAVTVDTTAPQKASVAKKITAQKKSSQWMLEAAVGMSDTYRFTGPGSSARFDNLYTTGPVTPQSAAVPLLNPGSSFSFHFGISRRLSFSPHWQGQVALRYQLLSSLQQYGASIDSAAGSSQNFSSRNTSTSIYSTGVRKIYHNYVHQLQLTPRMAYIINPKAASPLDFHTGFSIAYNFVGNQLLHDYRTRTYIRSVDYSTRWLASAEIGAGIFIHRKIYTGITYQHGVSNVARPALQSDFRWRVWQVQLGIPLFNRSSK